MEESDDTWDREENTMGKALQGRNSVIYWTNRKKHHIKTKKRQQIRQAEQTWDRLRFLYFLTDHI